MKVYDCPCDSCKNRTKCRDQALECKGVKQYYDRGWFQTEFVGLKIKPMRMRK